MGDDPSALPWYQFSAKTKIFRLFIEVSGGLELGIFGISLILAKSPYSYGLIHLQLVFLFCFLDIAIFNKAEEDEPK